MKIDHKWIEENLAGRYTINSDGSYDVNGNVKLPEDTTEIVIKFNNVAGNFFCGKSNIKSLNGCPNNVGKDFCCYNCINLTSLKYSPSIVGEDFSCSDCINLTSLEGSPNSVGGDFFCFNCFKITSPMDLPNSVGGSFYCNNTGLLFDKIEQDLYLDYLLKYGVINEIEYMKRKL